MPSRLSRFQSPETAPQLLRAVLVWGALIPKKKGRSLEGPGPFFVVFFVF
jgi:hypothetical protein